MADPRTAEILTELGLVEYIPLFAEEQITHDVISSLTTSDLHVLGISMGGIMKLRNYSSSQAPSPQPQAPTPPPASTWSTPTSNPTNSFGPGINRARPGADDFSDPPRSSMGDRSEFNYTPDVDGLFNEHANTGIDFAKYDELKVEAYGNNIPPAAFTFAEMNLPRFLMDNLKRMQWTVPTPIQRYCIPSMMQHRNVMGGAQTGSGKTGAFLIPILAVLKEGGNGNAAPFALIIAPTRELVQQIYQEALKFTHGSPYRAAVCFGGSSLWIQAEALRRGCDILVGTPGRLMDYCERGVVSLRQVRHLVLDEADRMLDMGFERDIRRIVESLGMPDRTARQMSLFSATLQKPIITLALDFLDNEVFFKVGAVGSTTSSITQVIRWVEEPQKTSILLDLLQETQGSTLVFCGMKRTCDEVAQCLGRQAVVIHGDKAQVARERALHLFRSGSVRVLVATDIAARGLDIPKIELVVNYDLPGTVDDYVHRIGRTGRAGRRGLAHAFFNYKNYGIQNQLIALLCESGQQLPDFFNARDAQYERDTARCRGGR